MVYQDRDITTKVNGKQNVIQHESAWAGYCISTSSIATMLCGINPSLTLSIKICLTDIWIFRLPKTGVRGQRTCAFRPPGPRFPKSLCKQRNTCQPNNAFRQHAALHFRSLILASNGRL